MNSQQQSNSSFLSQLSLLTFLFLLPIISAAHPPTPTINDTDFIRTSCNVTLYPDICYTSLSRYASAVQNNSAKLARVALSVSLSKARHMRTYVTNLSRQTNTGGGGASTGPQSLAALHDCYSTFDDAVDQIQRSVKEMRVLGSGEQFRFQMSNVQTWMSAALTNEETCTDGFEEVLDGPMKTGVCSRASVVKKFTSNGLALVNSVLFKKWREGVLD